MIQPRTARGGRAQLALGYRHMMGLGVPRSCAAAVLYYQPVAEQVVELARRPSALPHVRGPPPPHTRPLQACAVRPGRYKTPKRAAGAAPRPQRMSAAALLVQSCR